MERFFPHGHSYKAHCIDLLSALVRSVEVQDAMCEPCLIFARFRRAEES